MLQKIQDYFTESIQIQITAANLLPEKLQYCANKMVDCLLQGNKIIVCGSGRSYSNAQLFVSNLLQRYSLERPSLAAHLLSFEGMFASYLEQEDNISEIYKKQLSVIAQEGDLLVVFTPLGNEKTIHNTISANEKNLSVIAFTSNGNIYTQGLLSKNDIEIAIPAMQEMRIIEGHQFCVNLLCDLIDSLLFNTSPHLLGEKYDV